jgi:hypothetical protein
MSSRNSRAPRLAVASQLELIGVGLAVIEKSVLTDVLCGKFVGGRGIELFNEVVRRNLEGVVAKRKNGTYSASVLGLKLRIQIIRSQSEGMSFLNHDLPAAFRGPGTVQLYCSVRTLRSSGEPTANALTT